MKLQARAEGRSAHGAASRLRALAAVALLSACGPAADPVSVDDPWSPPSPPGATVAAAYMQITAREADVLLSAGTPIAGRTEVHETSMDDGVMRMRPLPELAIPADETIRFEPGGRHFMLMDLKSHPPAGATFPLTLNFRRAGAIQVEVAVQPAEER